MRTALAFLVFALALALSAPASSGKRRRSVHRHATRSHARHQRPTRFAAAEPSTQGAREGAPRAVAPPPAAPAVTAEVAPQVWDEEVPGRPVKRAR